MNGRDKIIAQLQDGLKRDMAASISAFERDWDVKFTENEIKDALLSVFADRRGDMYTITLRCSKCKESATHSAPRHIDVMMAFHKAGWGRLLLGEQAIVCDKCHTMGK